MNVNKEEYLFESLFSFPCSIYPEVEFLGHMVDIFLIFLSHLHIVLDSN